MSCCVRLFTWLVLIASGYLLLFTLYDTLRIACEYFQRDQLYVTYNNNYNFMDELQDPQIYQISIQPDIQIQKLDLFNNKDDLTQKQADNKSQKYNHLSKKSKNSFDSQNTEKLNGKLKRVQNGGEDSNLRNKIQKLKKQQQQQQQVTKKSENDRRNRKFVEQHQRKKRNGQKNGPVFYVTDDHFVDCVQRKTLPGLRGKIIKSFVRARNPKMCKNIAENDVKLVGLVAMHHKAGTVLRKGFYFSICARSGINFVMLQDLPIQLIQNTHFSNWQNYSKNDSFQNLQNKTVNGMFSKKSSISEKRITKNRIVQTRKLNYRVESNDKENFQFDENKQFNFNIFKNAMQNNGSIHGSNVICRDYHPCNNRAIVHAKITFRENCFEMGVECKNWYSILCFVQQCKNKLKINENIRIINPIRNPFNMIISAYLYHKGSSPENWAQNLTLGQIGFLHPVNGKDLQNISLSNALKQHNTRVGLEIIFRVMSNDLLDMLLLHQFSKTQKNIISSKFEECMNMFNVSMMKELDFIGFYDEKVSQQEKEQIVEYGSWVTSEGNLKMQRRKRHITSNLSKQTLYQVLQNHFRFKQLQKIAEMLGYDSQLKI